MAITQDEMQDIVNAVISAIRTNSRTIDQLTPVTSLSDNDSIEINGGKRVSVGVIKSLIEALATSEHDSLKILITKQELSSLDISATDEEVTMTVSSKSKTVSASLPIATITSAGVVKAADMVKLQSAYNKANEAETQSAALQTALETLRVRLSTGEGRIATNENDIATLQDDLQSVVQALNALSGSGDTTAVIDTFNEVVDFLAGIANDETLSAKLMELKGLLKDHGDDIEGLKEQVTQITQTVDEDRELQNSQANTIRTLQEGLGEAQNELGELSQLLVDYEDDAALALSNAEARLGKRIEAVGILPFNAIVEAHGSVSDGAPDYATQFPSAVDGAYRHIIFDKSRGTFLWEIHAGDYPDCPAGDAYTSWEGSGEYVAEGHPRTDRLYRMNNELYRWKDGVLQPIEAPNGTLTLETGGASYDIPISVGESVKKKKVGKYEDMVLTASVKNNELYLETSRPLADDEYAALLTCGKTKNTYHESDEDYYSRYRWHVRHQFPADSEGSPTGRGCTFEVEADGLWLCNGVTIRERLEELSCCGSVRPRAYRCQGSRMALHPGQTVTVTYGVAIYTLDETLRLRRKSNVVYFYVDYFATSDEELAVTTIRI